MSCRDATVGHRVRCPDQRPDVHVALLALGDVPARAEPGLEVDDADAVYERLIGHGYSAKAPPRDRAWGKRGFGRTIRTGSRSTCTTRWATNAATLLQQLERRHQLIAAALDLGAERTVLHVLAVQEELRPALEDEHHPALDDRPIVDVRGHLVPIAR